MEVFYGNYTVKSPELNTEETMEQQDHAAEFADRVREVGIVINITETFSENLFKVTVWYLSPYKLEI